MRVDAKTQYVESLDAIPGIEEAYGRYTLLTNSQDIADVMCDMPAGTDTTIEYDWAIGIGRMPGAMFVALDDSGADYGEVWVCDSIAPGPFTELLRIL